MGYLFIILFFIFIMYLHLLMIGWLMICVRKSIQYSFNYTQVSGTVSNMENYTPLYIFFDVEASSGDPGEGDNVKTALKCDPRAYKSLPHFHSLIKSRNSPSRFSK